MGICYCCRPCCALVNDETLENVFSKSATAQQIIEQLGENARDKTYFVTGANAGVGYVTTKWLLKSGATVVIGCRSEKRAKQAMEDLIKDGELEDNSKLKLIIMDLSDLETIREVPAKLDELGVSKLDCLINNAGLAPLQEYRETSQGYEMQWGVNHLGHFYLTKLLDPYLQKSDDKRVVILSSIAHQVIGLPTESKKMIYPVEKDKYNPNNAYGWSKMCNVLHAEVIEANLGITSYSLHPGWVYGSNLVNNIDLPACCCCCSMSQIGWCTAMCVGWCCCDYNVKTLEQGAATSLVCALQDQSKLTSGGYYQCCNLAPKRSDIPDVGQGLWAYSCELVDNFETQETTEETKKSQ